MKEFLRLFISIDFSEEIKDTLYGLAMELKKHSQKGYITKRENFHLTLAFIGETKRVQSVISAMEDTVKATYLPPFQLNTKGAGRFSGRGRDIYWIGIEENEMLNRLNAALVRELIKREFKMEERAYKPHLTLGREIVLKEDYTFGEFAKKVPDLSIRIDRINLMKSDRINGKLTYTTIFTKELADTL